MSGITAPATAPADSPLRPPCATSSWSTDGRVFCGVVGMGVPTPQGDHSLASQAFQHGVHASAGRALVAIELDGDTSESLAKTFTARAVQSERPSTEVGGLQRQGADQRCEARSESISLCRRPVAVTDACVPAKDTTRTDDCFGIVETETPTERFEPRQRLGHHRIQLHERRATVGKRDGHALPPA
jgi:hypothetical protein